MKVIPVFISQIVGAASILLIAGSSSAANVVAWGNNGANYYFTNVPASVTNAISVAAGATFDLALLADGRVVAWGQNATVPATATNVVAIAADRSALALRADGTLVAWGDNNLTNVPTSTNTVAIALGTGHALALQADGTVLTWGGGQDQIAKGLSNVVAIAASGYNYVALQKNGSYVRWDNYNNAISGKLSDVVAVAINSSDLFFLKGNGEVKSPNRKLPKYINTAQAVAAGSGCKLVLNSDGTLTAWADTFQYLGTPSITNLPATATNVIAMSAYGYHALAVVGDGNPRFTGPVAYRNSASVGTPLPLFARAVGPNLSYQWLSDGTPIPGATNANPNLVATLGSDSTSYQVLISNPYGWALSDAVTVSISPITFWGIDVWNQSQIPNSATNPVALSARSYHTLALNADGTLTTWGKNVAGLASIPAKATNIAAIATGAEHSLALKDDGTVVAWGRNSDGQTTVPANATNVIAISAGSLHSVALRADGTVVAWGNDDVGQSTVSVLATEVTRIACGYFHTLALRADGRVIGWGSDIVVPDAATNTTAIAAGFGHDLALKADGTVLAWGDNTFGQTTIPASATNVVAIAAGWYYSMALKADGSTVMWGKGSTNAPALSNIGSITAGEDSWTAIAASGPPQFALPLKSMQANLGGPAVLTAGLADGFAGTCQWYYSGAPVSGATNSVLFLRNVQAGQGGSYVLMATNAFGQASSQPIQLTVQPTPASYTAVGAWGGDSVGQTELPAGIVSPRQISAAGFHGLILQEDGTVVGWGDNHWRERDIPASATNVPGVKIVSIASARDHNLALRNDGTVVAWGYNGDGQTNVPASASNIVAIAAGAAHSLALRNDGCVIAWGCGKGNTNYTGNNDYGQVDVPASLTNVIAIAAGYYHSLALCSNHTVVAWGMENSVPDSATNVIALAAGFAHSLALRADGTVVAWGDNTFGQTTVPPTATNIVAIAAGWFHSMGLQADGTVVVWGTNYFGLTNVPNGLSNVSAISAGDDFCVALAETGAPLVKNITSDISAHVGGQALFTAQIGGTTPLVCQWYHENSPINGATNRCLVLTNVQLTDQGAYYLIVTNAAGQTVSDPVSFAVFASPSFAAASKKTVAPGASLSLTASATGAQPLFYQWQHNGQNLANTTHVTGSGTGSITIDSASYGDSGTYSIIITNAYGACTGTVAQVAVTPILAWGDNYSGQLDIPAEASNVVAIAAGEDHSLALRADGTVVAWGDNTYKQLDVPASAVNVVAVAAGGPQSLALRADGTVVAWGSYSSNVFLTNSYYAQTNVPTAATNVVAIAAGRSLSEALRSDGTLFRWGTSNPSSVSSTAIMISAEEDHDVHLAANNTLWEYDYLQIHNPFDDSPIIAIATGGRHGLALRADGTVNAWGDNYYQQCVVPDSAARAIAVAGGGDHSLALRADKTVVAWGANYAGQATVPASATNISAIAGGGAHSLALIDTGVHPGFHLSQQSTAGQQLFLTAGATPGTSTSYQWQLNGTDIPGATNSALLVNSLRFTNSGIYSLVISNAFGTWAGSSMTLSVPRSQMVLSSGVNGAPSGSVWFQLSGGSGVNPITVYSSTNLVDWEPVLTNAPTLAPVTFPASFVTNGPVRFYRAQEAR